MRCFVHILQSVSAGLFVVLTFLSSACSAETPETEAPAPEAASIGFEAEIRGAYTARVAGPGVLVFVPDGGFEGQGYFFLADGQGLRPHGITLVLPAQFGPGRHILESPNPLDIGTVPSVRVDREEGASVASYQERTAGFLDLNEFPDNADNLSGTNVDGSFNFETENAEGEVIVVSGTFSFETD